MQENASDISENDHIEKKSYKDVIIYGLLFIFFCLSFPWELTPFPLSEMAIVDTGGGAFVESRLFLYITLSCLIILYLISNYLKGKIEFRKTSIDLPVGMFIVISLLSILRFYDIHAGLDTFFLLLAYTTFFYLLINNIEGFGDIKLVIYALVGIGVISSMYGLYQYLVGFKELERYIAEQSLAFEIPSRVFTIFISPNNLAGFLIMIIPLAFVIIMNTQESWKKIIILAALILMIDCLLLTQSRGGWISFGIVTAVLIAGYAWIKRKGSLGNIIWITVIVTVTTILIIKLQGILSPTTPTYSALSLSKSAFSMEGRLLLWKGTLQIIKRYPIAGIGLGAFQSVYPMFQQGGLYSKYAHNLYLEVFAETGIFGFLSLISIFFLIVVKGIVLIKRKSPIYSELGIALLAASLGFMVHNFVDFEWNMAVAGLMFWINAALMFCCDRLAGEKEGLRQEGQVIAISKKYLMPVVLGSTAIISIMVIAFTSAAWAQYLYNKAQNAYGEGELRYSVRLLEKAVRYDPINANIQNKLALGYFEESISAKSDKSRDSLLSKSIDRSKTALKLRPTWGEYYAQLGVINTIKGNIKTAKKYFNESQRLYPKNPLFIVATGELYFSQKDYKKAEEEFNKALKLREYYLEWYPEQTKNSFARAHLNLGLLYSELDKKDQAEKEFDEVLKIDPENEIALKGKEKLKSGRKNGE